MYLKHANPPDDESKKSAMDKGKGKETEHQADDVYVDAYQSHAASPANEQIEASKETITVDYAPCISLTLVGSRPKRIARASIVSVPTLSLSSWLP